MSSLRKGMLLAASLGVISLGTVAVAVSLPSAAGAAGSKPIVTLGAQAELFARGAAVGVPVHITCSAPAVPNGLSLSQNVSVQLSEVVAGDVVQQGYGSASEFICDGSPHHITVYVIPNGSAGPLGGSASHPFTDGTAFASAQLSVCSMPGIFPTSSSPFASPTPPPMPPPLPSPMPSPGPGFPGFPSCQSAQHMTVISIQGDNEG
ncbi:MAG TPA: hypothetical protein VJ010_09405 [Actinomycetota bacterium]|nr:hypothetical protein [Actinomycetota bacterium]